MTADPRKISIDAYDYTLPPERIARHPLTERDACRLLVSAGGYDSAPLHTRFAELPRLLPEGALLVRNNTRVIPARLRMHKPTGGAVEIFLLDPASPADYASCFEAKGECEWMCLVGNLKRWHDGAVSCRAGDSLLKACRMAAPDNAGMVRVKLCWEPADVDFASLLEKTGRIPIPPYLERESEDSDTTDYQTVYSRIRGSVAAPTAGLHFTPALFDKLRLKGVETADVTLHVGAGTFKPVKSATMEGHTMHTERFEVDATLLRKLLDAIRGKRPVIAVGTTSVRTLESLPLLGMKVAAGMNPAVGQWDAYPPADDNLDTSEALEALLHHTEERGGTLHASTALMIAPGFKWRIVTGMVTNFHQPRSTLLLLVSAFLERNGGDGDRWRRLYGEALSLPGYRFLSYGDACLLL